MTHPHPSSIRIGVHESGEQEVAAKIPQTTTQRTAAHRRRMAERLARYEGALKAIINRYEGLKVGPGDWEDGFEGGLRTAAEMAQQGLNPTIPTADAE
jgi:hypothetical protein